MNKDKRWIIQNDPGILRKKSDAETDLFVFGYACKIFRDDQKALEMDQGKHLIPWMGDETLKVDRYDARGHLSEISQFEGTNQDYVLTPEERRIEQLCDEERYRALHHNEEEQEMYQEEELKRLKQALSSDKEYRQVAYQYDNDGAPPSNSDPDPSNMEDGEPFVPSPSLYIPANMKLPSTVKENQIIEKTAAHVASHGPQVEILIKTRQANNQKLNFLHIGSPLNPYYNFILTQIKTGRYKPAFMVQQEAEINQENDHYLHPSLAPAPSTTVESAPSIPSIAYKPSSDCSYNMLVNKIRNMQQSQVEEVGEAGEPSTSGDSPPSRRIRRKRHSTQPHATAPNQKQVAVPPQHVKEIISRLINFAHSQDVHPSKIASNLLKKDSKNLGFLDPGHKYYDYYVQQIQETYKENIYNLSNPAMEAADNEETNHFDLVSTYDPERPTEEDLEHSISENGDTPTHQQDSSGAVSPSAENDQDVPPSEYDVPNQPTSKPAPVCFSIKKPKETERLEHVSAFPLEETSSEEEGKEQGEHLAPEIDKEKSNEGDKLKSPSSLHTEESVKTPVKSPKEKEQTAKYNKQSPGSAGSQEVILIPSQSSSEGSRKSASSSDSKKTSTTDSSKISITSTESRKSYSSDSKRSLTSIDSKKSITSSDSRTSIGSSRKSLTPSDSSRKTTHTSSENSRKSLTSTDNSRKSVTPSDSSRRSIRTNLTSSDSSRKSKERKSHRKYKSSSSSSPDKYREQYREKKKTLDDKSYQETILRLRRESDDLPPLPEDSITNLSTVPEENLEKKREERKKKVKQMIEKIKTESLGVQENSQAAFKAGSASSLASSDMSISFSKSFMSHDSPSLASNKSNSKTEDSKTDSQKDFEEQLREQVKQSLKKIAETTLAAIPPISEDSCSQFDHSSAANSNGFESPTSCGRPVFRVSRTPSIGIMDTTLQEASSSRSSSTVSHKSHKKKKHHKKKKKHKGRSKGKKHRESYSESSSEDDSSDDAWVSSSSADSEQPKKRHKKSSKHSRKRHKRKHRKHSSTSSSSSD